MTRLRALCRHGKGGHQRILPVTDDIAAVLAAYTRSHRAGPLIRRLDGPEAIGDSHLGKMVRAWMEAAGIKDGGVLPAGLPEVCDPDGNTWLTVTPCTAENPTIEQACADPAYAPYFQACTLAPSSTVALPTTGTTAAGGAAIGGTVLLALGVAALTPSLLRRRRAQA